MRRPATREPRNPNPAGSLCLCLVLLTPAALTAQAPVTRQTPAAAPPTARPADPALDPALDRAQQWKGRALLLRGSFAADRLTFDSRGHLLGGSDKSTDWTLAGFELDQVSRGTAPSALELDGLRVAIRYNPQQHLFERHPQKDQHIHITIAAGPDADSADEALRAVFSVGMDPAFERAAKPWWSHYFNPAEPWPKDVLTGQSTLPAAAALPAGVIAATAEKKVEPEFTPEAQRDRVKGEVILALVIDPTGIARRIRIVQPLGYGLDEKTVAAAARYRFHPATRDGVPVAAEIILHQQFDYAVAPPH